jgi:hypothetical protein
MHARLAVLVSLAALLLPAVAGGTVDASNSFRFGFVPQKAFKGQPANISVVARPTGVLCAASIRYSDGAIQRLASARVRAGKASWRWIVPGTAAPGLATARVSCGTAGKGTHRFSVVRPPTVPARITVKNSGFSQRIRSTTRYVSYGIELANASPENDALDVEVLVNFLDATNRVVDTVTDRIDAVGAGTVYYHGGSTTIPDGSPVSKLEIVTRLGGQFPKRTRLGPQFGDILIQAQRSDPAWVGAVVGQVVNDAPAMLLRRTQISTVVYDSAGVIIGGATGFAGDSLLPGVRAYFQVNRGCDAIPFERAAAASVSTLGSYEPIS